MRHGGDGWAWAGTRMCGGGWVGLVLMRRVLVVLVLMLGGVGWRGRRVDE